MPNLILSAICLALLGADHILHVSRIRVNKPSNLSICNFACLRYVWFLSLQGETGPYGQKGERGMTGDQGHPGGLGMKGEKGLPGAPGSRVSVSIYSRIRLWVCLAVALQCAKIDEVVLTHTIDAPSLFIVLEKELQ